ncbi:MAG: hypothetical protein ACXVHC_01805 [Frankiaceae bacterium]
MIAPGLRGAAGFAALYVAAGYIAAIPYSGLGVSYVNPWQLLRARRASALHLALIRQDSPTPKTALQRVDSDGGLVLTDLYFARENEPACFS